MSRRYNRYLFIYDRDNETQIVTGQRQYYDTDGTVLTIIPPIFFTRRLFNGRKIGIRPRQLRFMRVCRNEGEFTTFNPFPPVSTGYKTFVEEFVNSAKALPGFPSYYSRGESSSGST